MEDNYIIYAATNIENGWVYIGSTTSTIEDRKKDHLAKAALGTGQYFQEALSTFGPESFTWEQIDTASTNNELAKKEREYIIEYNSNDTGYNLDCGGGFNKEVYQYNNDGYFIASFDNLESASNEVSATSQSISAACLGKIKTCKGFYWSYEFVEKLDIPKDKRFKKVYQYTLDYNFIQKFKSVSEASRMTGVNKSGIAKTCRGVNLSSGGFVWKYE